MKTVQEILPALENPKALSTAMPSASDGLNKSESANEQRAMGTALSVDSIELLFQTFARRWSHRWERTFADGKARSLWRYDLLRLGVSDATLRVGLGRSVDREWPPSPAEFAALCEPDDGLPDADTAYRRAVVAHWSHPVVYEAARRVGVFELSRWAENRSRPAYERAFKQVCTEWRSGTRFDVPKRPAIEHRPQHCDPAIARAHLDKIKAMLRGAA